MKRARTWGKLSGVASAYGTTAGRAWALVLAAAVGAGCAASTGKGADGDPERMSRSEYDVALDLWLRQQQPRQALKHALGAVEFDDENHEAAHLVALIYLDFCRRTPEDCRLKDAEKHVRMALEAKPDFREATNTLGVILIHQKRYRAAIDTLKPLTADILYQTPENAWGNLGWAYLDSGQTKPAIEALRRSVAAQPLFCVGYYRLGVAYHRNGQSRQALEALTQALETDDPRCKRLQAAMAERARVRHDLGESEAAREDLDACVRLSRSTKAGKECASMRSKLK